MDALNNEILRIVIGNSAFEAHDTLTASPAKRESSAQYFRFVSHGNGCKICPANDSRAVTLSEGCVGLESFSESSGQIWDIVPCDDMLMLKCGAGVLTLGGSCKARLISPHGWTRFGEAYLNHICFEKTKHLRKPLKNYFSNVDIGLDSSSKEAINGCELLINQSGGSFPMLKFGQVKMSGVCCEVMAAYNALTLAGAKPDFFRLAVEFEMNAAIRLLGLAPKGTWGSDPRRIGRCLSAYNVPFRRIEPNEQANFDHILSHGKAGIIACRLPVMGLYLGIHTFAAVSENGMLRTYNRFGNQLHSALYPSLDAVLNCGKHRDRFMVGYVLN